MAEWLAHPTFTQWIQIGSQGLHSAVQFLTEVTPLANWVAAQRKTGTLRLEVVPRLQDQRGFQVLRKRWIVERTFGWFMKHRRLVRHYEVKTAHAEAWLHISMIGVMLRRLA
jgi:hypothetical protein